MSSINDKQEKEIKEIKLKDGLIGNTKIIDINKIEIITIHDQLINDSMVEFKP